VAASPLLAARTIILDPFWNVVGQKGKRLSSCYARHWKPSRPLTLVNPVQSAPIDKSNSTMPNISLCAAINTAFHMRCYVKHAANWVRTDRLALRYAAQHFLTSEKT
jgi:hypothetical protein